MSYYSTFMHLRKTPAEQIRNHLQMTVNQRFEVSSTYYKIEEEVTPGSLEFRIIDARISSLVNSNTGQRVRDDYKKIIFRDIAHNPKLGARYRFENNIWIAVSTNDLKTNSSNIYLRRCNNTINTQDKYGNIHREPCIIDYIVNETQPYKQNAMDVSNAKIFVQCQHNDKTQYINVNDRYMFGNSVYRLRESHDFDRTETYNEDSKGLLFFQADFDELAPDDNKELKIANYKAFNYDILAPTTITGSVGDTGNIEYSVLLNSSAIQTEMIFESFDDEVITVNENGYYEVVGEGITKIKATLKVNRSIEFIIDVDINDSPEEVYQNIIDPVVTNIKLNREQVYTVYEYKNGIKQDTPFVIEFYDMPNSNYSASCTDNSFAIKNLKTSENNLLRVICTNTRTLETSVIFIRLGGVF